MPIGTDGRSCASTSQLSRSRVFDAGQALHHRRERHPIRSVTSAVGIRRVMGRTASSPDRDRRQP